MALYACCPAATNCRLNIGSARLNNRIFIAQLVSALAWPVTVLICAALRRSPLARLIPLVRTLRYSDIEVRFGREVKLPAAASMQPVSVRRHAATADLGGFGRPRPCATWNSDSPIVAARRSYSRTLAKSRQLKVAEAVWQVPMVLGALMLNAGVVSNHQYRLGEVRFAQAFGCSYGS